MNVQGTRLAGTAELPRRSNPKATNAAKISTGPEPVGLDVSDSRAAAAEPAANSVDSRSTRARFASIRAAVSRATGAEVRRVVLGLRTTGGGGGRVARTGGGGVARAGGGVAWTAGVVGVGACVAGSVG